MKKKLTIFSIIFIMLVAMVFPNNVFAASASITASSTSIYVGETATINININSTETWSLNISASGGNLSKTSDADAYGEEKTTTAMTATFSASEPGTYTISLSGTVAGSDLVKKQVSDSVTVTVKAKETNSGSSGGSSSSGSNSGSQDRPNESNVPTETTKPKTETEKSSNNYLSGITLSTGTLSPEFYRETFEYTVEFDDTVNLYELTEMEITAQAEDSRASIQGAGTVTLNEGENSFSINVTAENGAVRTYTIKVNKPAPVEQSSLRLKTLILNGINTNGEYQTIDFTLEPEVFEYNLTVPNNISSVSINPTTENEDIIIETNGETTLKEGENKIVIILTSPSDETITTTYTLNIERQAAIVEEQGLTQEQIGMIIIGGIVGVILLIIIITLIVKHRRKKKVYDYDEYDDEYNNAHLENNEEDDIIDPYPQTIKTRENEEEPISEKNESIEKHEETMGSNVALKTENEVEENKTAKLKWDDFCDTYDEEEENESKKVKDKKKGGKRFM